MRVRAFVIRLGYAFKSIFFKRNKKIILFGSWYGEKFADNTRFLYQYLFENKKELGLEKVVWVTRNDVVFNTMHEMGYEVYMMDSPESIYYHKIAGYHIICNAPGRMDAKGDILGQYSYGAVRINLWHGLGNKKTGKLSNQISAGSNLFKSKMNAWLSKKSCLYRMFYLSDGGWANRYFLVPTEMMADVFKEEYLIDDKHIIKSGYPRNCPCPRLTREEERTIKCIKQHRYSVLYLPTFRQENNFCCSDTAKGIKSYLKKGMSYGFRNFTVRIRIIH